MRMTEVVAAVLEREGRILICQRTATQPHPFKWEFPGGKVEPGESAPQALRRELEEELGIQADIGDEITRYDYAYPGKKPIRLIFLKVNGFSGELRNRIFERMEWECPTALAAYDFLEGDIQFIRAL